jgi:nucleoid-associated protein YgaU
LFVYPPQRKHPGHGVGGHEACSRARHTEVRPGESLWSIAGDALATDDGRRIALYWPRIYRANRPIVGSNPDLIYPGQELRLPPECGR